MNLLTAQHVQQKILAVLFRHLSPTEWDVYLFGSFGRGTATMASDIDLAVRGPGPLPPASAARILADLEENVPLLRDFDLVDLATANAALRMSIEREGIPWHLAAA
jgi:predicted nucleotidyltransferase